MLRRGSVLVWWEHAESNLTQLFRDRLSFSRYDNRMKILKLATLFVTCVILGWMSVGCSQAQVAPTSYEVSLTWTAPSASGTWGGCTTASPCTYAISRIVLTAGTTSCPAANTTTPNYTPLDSSTPTSGTTYVDTGVSGETVCYIAQTEQGTAVSNPSNTAGPFAVPASPLAPSLAGTQTVATEKPLPAPSGDSQAPVLSAKLTPVR